MTPEMTPRPEIEITEETMPPAEIAERREFLQSFAVMNLGFQRAFEAWRDLHLMSIGYQDQYDSREDFLRAIVDPDPYDKRYVFYCLTK